jgi:hypothetical protein
MIKYDKSILQSVTATNMVNLLLKLHKEMKMWKDEYSRTIDSSDPYIVKDTDFNSLNESVKRLKNDHHKALNSLRDFKGKIHSEQIKYMDSGARRERYKTPTN